MQLNFLLPGGMIAQLKEDKLEADRKLIKIPPHSVKRKLGGTMDENILDEQQITIKEIIFNSTNSKAFISEIPKIATIIIKEINTKRKEGYLIPHESTTKDNLEENHVANPVEIIGS